MRWVIKRLSTCSLFFFFTDTSNTEIYTLSLHDALPISCKNKRKNAETDSSGIFTCRNEKKTAETDSSGGFTCKNKKKNAGTISSGVFTCRNEKKPPKQIGRAHV